MDPITAQKIIIKSKKIGGWFSSEAAMLIAMIDEVQKDMNLDGDIFEIGVHHGKSSIFFSHLLRDQEFISICDLFGTYGNVSNSGDGNYDVFFNNMKKYALKQAKDIHVCLSSTLTPEVIGKNYRIFHIDGGHNSDEALNDLILATKVVNEKGIIILDDPFRAEWPGVTEALIKFLQMDYEYDSVVVGFNKLVLSKKSVSEKYKQFINNNENIKSYGLSLPWGLKELPFLNGTISIFFIPTRFLGTKRIKIFISKILQTYPWLRLIVNIFRRANQ